jgi:hypothetical protein
VSVRVQVPGGAPCGSEGNWHTSREYSQRGRAAVLKNGGCGFEFRLAYKCSAPWYYRIMRDVVVFREALRRLDDGQNARQIGDDLGVPWGTVRYWKTGRCRLDRPAPRSRRTGYLPDVCAPDLCPWMPPRNQAAYVYLLGLYLGDGTIQRAGRSAQLRICLDDRYPGIQDECITAIAKVSKTGVFRVQEPGCTRIVSASIHWRCVFPQHGPGRKHTRTIELADWQQHLADKYPASLLRGLIHSDGCRDLNHVKGRDYPRYSFSNRSQDLHAIFRKAATTLGLRYTTRLYVTQIARRADVAVLDGLIGPKR